MSRQGGIEAADGLVRRTRTVGGHIRMRRFDDHRHRGDAYQNLHHYVYAKQNLYYMFHIRRMRPALSGGESEKEKGY